MAYINNMVWRRIFSKPFENFVFENGNVNYTYQNLMLIRKTNGFVDLTFFNTPDQIKNYWRNAVHRWCPCNKFLNLYRINPHAKSFLRIEPIFLHFIMPYFFLYCEKYYFGRYPFLWYDYIVNSSLPYDNEYNKACLCVLM